MNSDLLEDVVGLFYDQENNVFEDEDGFVVWTIFEHVRPSDLLLFRLNRQYLAVPHRERPRVLCELYWPEEDWDENQS